MVHNFVACDREQLMLMPASMADWLREDHLAWFVLVVVAELDLSTFRSAYRVDGRGGAAYDPEMMLALLVYSYCVGERSSCRIERRLVEDVASRVVAANEHPDHATIARFRANHETAVAGLFGQVLAVCALGLGCSGRDWSRRHEAERERVARCQSHCRADRHKDTGRRRRHRCGRGRGT